MADFSLKTKRDTKSYSCVLSMEKGFWKITKALNVIVDIIMFILIVGIPAIFGALLGAAIGWLIWMAW